MSQHQQPYDFDRAWRPVVPALFIALLILVLLWPPFWVWVVVALLAFLLGPALIGPGLDVRDERRNGLDLAVLQHRVMFGRRPLTRKEQVRLNRLLGQRVVAHGGVLVASRMSRRDADDVAEGLSVVFAANEGVK